MSYQDHLKYIRRDIPLMEIQKRIFVDKTPFELVKDKSIDKRKNKEYLETLEAIEF